MMHDNNDQCWVKYLKWVKFNYNTSYHTTIRMTPFEAVYGRPPFFGLATLNVPKEHWGVINNEDDLNNFQQTSVADSISASVDELSESSNLSDNEVLCAVCENETSGVHSCPECCRFVHVPCGIQQREEGFGSSVWCLGCFLKERSTNTHHLRKGIKRNQETLHDRVLKSGGKKFKPAEIGDTVLIPISQPDKMSSIGPRNLMGHIIDAQDSVYTVATSHGTISSGYARNQFDVCSFRISANESCHTSIVSQTEAMQSATLGLSGSACRCKHCKALRCPCKKSGRSCNTKCHKGHTCFNKFA